MASVVFRLWSERELVPRRRKRVGDISWSKHFHVRELIASLRRWGPLHRA